MDETILILLLNLLHHQDEIVSIQKSEGLIHISHSDGTKVSMPVTAYVYGRVDCMETKSGVLKPRKSSDEEIHKFLKKLLC